MKKICVVGAGVMGLDVAQVFAAKDFKVLVRDINDAILQKAQDRMKSSLEKLVSKGKKTQEEADKVIGNISFTTELKDAADADLVLEAIIENLEVKQGLFKELDGICKPDAIFASNTSSVSLTAMAMVTSRPDKFIGMHFFNPAGVMKLVEVIRGALTSDETFKTVYELASFIGKDPIEVKESPAFVVNRILIPMMNEAVCVLADGVASAEDIDKAMKLGASHVIGPLALCDLVGNDVTLNIMETLYHETGDPKYRPSVLLRQMVRAGKLGRKTGEGFFKY